MSQNDALPPWRGIELEIAELIVSNKELAVSVDGLTTRSTVTKWWVRALVVVAVVLSVFAYRQDQTAADLGVAQQDLGVVQGDLRGIQCDTATLWLSLLDLPQPEPDPPLTPEEQAQADVALAEFKATYEAIYESLACAELER